MESLKNNKLFWILIVVTVFNVGAFVVGKILINKTSDKVIEKLQKDYSPSPYGPGFDPDKVSPDAFKSSRQYFEMRKNDHLFMEDNLRGVDSKIIKSSIESDNWRDDWEKSRGF